MDGSPGKPGCPGLRGFSGPPGPPVTQTDILEVVGEIITGLQGERGLQGLSGSQGVRGVQGDRGSQGLFGSQGLHGIQGLEGSQGFQGPTGAQGNNGSQGVEGPQGREGQQGQMGLQGFHGPQGDQGSTGAQGSVGAQGVTGPTGLQGSQGGVGAQGDQGEAGPQGAFGLQGVAGPQGVQGGLGLQGNTGSQGDFGPQGLEGSQGFAGVQGPQGSVGSQGSFGLQGLQGIQGADGVQGPLGVQGSLGLQGGSGPQGGQGLQGLNGAQGLRGVQGVQGIQGPPGESGLGPLFCLSFEPFAEGLKNILEASLEQIRSLEWGASLFATVNTAMIYDAPVVGKCLILSSDTVTPTPGIGASLVFQFQAAASLKSLKVSALTQAGGSLTVRAYDAETGGNLIGSPSSFGPLLTLNSVVDLVFEKEGVRRLELDILDEPVGLLEVCYHKCCSVGARAILNLTDDWRLFQDVDGSLVFQFYSAVTGTWVNPIGTLTSILKKQKCLNPALDVAIVVDVSHAGLLGNVAANLVVRAAVKLLIDGLVGASSRVAITCFASRSAPTDGYVGTLNSYVLPGGILGGYFPLSNLVETTVAKLFVDTHIAFPLLPGEHGYTNWQAAFMSAQGPNTNTIQSTNVDSIPATHFDGPLASWPDRIILITDGEPDKYYSEPDQSGYSWATAVGPVLQPGTDSPVAPLGLLTDTTKGLSYGQKEADYVKNYCRVVALGVGDIVSPANVGKLKSVVTNSLGGVEPLEDVDYFTAATLSDLASAVNKLLSSEALC